MTMDAVQLRVAAITLCADCDPESAHSMEDDLHKEVMTHLLTMNLEKDHVLAKEMLTEALKTLALDFPRWCA